MINQALSPRSRMFQKFENSKSEKINTDSILHINYCISICQKLDFYRKWHEFHFFNHWLNNTCNFFSSEFSWKLQRRQYTVWYTGSTCFWAIPRFPIEMVANSYGIERGKCVEIVKTLHVKIFTSGSLLINDPVPVKP